MRRLESVMLVALLAAPLRAQGPPPGVRVVHDSIAVDFVDADLRGVVQALGYYLPKPVMITTMPGTRITLQTPGPVDRAAVRELLRGVLDAQNLELVEETAFFRVRERGAPAPAPVAAPAPQESRNPRPSGGSRLFVIRLRHARAPDVAATVNQLFGGSGTFSGSSALSTGTLSDELRRMNVPSSSVPQGVQPPAGTGGANLSGPVSIVPDEVTNSLLLRASQEDYAVVTQAVNELDIRPLQVLIEVLIVEARRDHTFSLGADLFVPRQEISHGAEGSVTVTGGGLGDLVVQVLNVGQANVSATLRAAESRGEVSITSRPVLLASNNTEARLLVGSQRPFVQVSRSLPTQTPTRDQVVQYRDVGTRLTVKPTINHDGYVSLQIQQEVSAATTETQFDAPIISTREAATRVLLHDGQTVVLGGLRDQQRDHTRRGVPFLSSLPLVGGLFGSDSHNDDATEFYLFLTPRILQTDADIDSVTAPRLRPVEHQ